MLNEKGIDIKRQYMNNIGFTKLIHANGVKHLVYKKVVLFGENTTLINTTLSDVVSIIG
ncbi:MAG TPA: hypothetical protein VIM42_06850 [Clostridium sp.]